MCAFPVGTVQMYSYTITSKGTKTLFYSLVQLHFWLIYHDMFSN